MSGRRTDVLRSIVARLLGGPCGPLRVAALGRSSSVTYRAQAAGRAVVIKTNESAEVLAGTAHNLAVLAELGIPVPTLVGVEHWSNEAGVGVLVMERLNGRDLHYELASMHRPQMTALAGQIVGFQRRVATLPHNRGCGFGAIGELTTRPWSDVVRRPTLNPVAHPPPADAAALLADLATALDVAEWYLAGVKPICFLDDLTTKNVMVADGRLSGVVDFDVVCYGDPLFHLGLTAAAVTANAPAASRFYVDELVRLAKLTAAQHHVVDLYEAMFLVNFLANEHPQKPGRWRAIAATAAQARLKTAGPFFALGDLTG